MIEEVSIEVYYVQDFSKRIQSYFKGRVIERTTQTLTLWGTTENKVLKRLKTHCRKTYGKDVKINVGRHFSVVDKFPIPSNHLCF